MLLASTETVLSSKNLALKIRKREYMSECSVTGRTTCAGHEQILKVLFCDFKFDLFSKSSSDRPGLVPRSLEPGESPSPSKLRPTCRELQLLFLVATVTCREEKLLKPAEWRRSLEAKRRTLYTTSTKGELENCLPKLQNSPGLFLIYA